MSFFVNDVMLTPEEVDGLMANLLVSKEAPRCKTSLKDWLRENKSTAERKSRIGTRKTLLKKLAQVERSFFSRLKQYRTISGLSMQP